LVFAPRGAPLLELREPAELQSDVTALIDCALEALLPDWDVEPGLTECGRERAERVPIEGLRGHRAAVLVEVPGRGRPLEPLPQFAQELEQLISGREASRNEPGGPLRRIPAPEVLDYRLRVHHGLLVGRELAHRR